MNNDRRVEIRAIERMKEVRDIVASLSPDSPPDKASVILHRRKMDSAVRYLKQLKLREDADAIEQNGEELWGAIELLQASVPNRDGWIRAFNDRVAEILRTIDGVLPLFANESQADELSPSLEAVETNIPALVEGSEEWVSNKKAANILHVTVKTLANKRSAGEKGPDETWGLHDVGCFWRKKGNNHPFYYLPRMREHAGHLVDTFPLPDSESLENLP